jgi:ATP/maltotriose-dependent transcriptional regulator MalT
LTLDRFRRCKTEQNLTGASLPQIRRGLAQARRMLLALRVNEAFDTINRVELQLDDLPATAAERFRAATELLRAIGLAFQDDSLATLSIATSYLKKRTSDQGRYAASTLCRFGFWQLGEFDSLYSLPRSQPGARSSKSRTIFAVLDLSIEAAAALDQLQISTAKRLASDALSISETELWSTCAPTFPACLTAQVLYEEGRLDEADIMLRDRLSTIGAQGSVECALRAYMILVRIATYRMQYNLAGLLLREAEALGNRRGWPRLVAASLGERILLLLQEGRMKEVRLCAEHLDRYAEAHSAGPTHPRFEVARYRTLAHWRMSWVESPSREAVAALRLLYHNAVEKRDFYTGCRLAVELAEMLAAIGETEEADALFLQILKFGAAAGLYQLFLDGGAGLGALLRRAYEHAESLGSMERELLPYLGSLISRRDARDVKRRSVKPSSRIGDTLSTRECDILALIGRGFSNKRIAQALKISPETVKSHVKRIFLKLAVGTRTEAVARAGVLGLL